MRGVKDDPEPTLLQRQFDLKTKLLNLEQCLDPDEDKCAAPLKRTRVLATAELYRLASLLYLLQVCPAVKDGKIRADCLEKAFAALKTLQVASSPWPVFILACESQSDEQRIAILQTLDQMHDTRSIGNILVMRDIVEKIWKQSDLQSDAVPSLQLAWCQFIKSDIPVPWFA